MPKKDSFKKETWNLFKIDRKDFNKFDRKCSIILESIYKNGLCDGMKKSKIEAINLLKNLRT